MKGMVYVFVVLPNLLMAVAFAWPLLLRREGMFLGAHVRPEFSGSAEAGRLRRGLMVGSAALGFGSAAMSVVAVEHGRTWMVSLTSLVEVAGFVLLRVFSWRALTPFRSGGTTPRVASFGGGGFGGTALGSLAALLPLCVAALILRMRWSSIPERFPTHWGISGQADGWGTRSVGSVMMPLEIGAVMIVWLTVLGMVMTRYAAGHRGQAATTGLSMKVVRGASWLMGVLFAGVALMPLATSPGAIVPFVVVGSLLSGLGLVGYAVLQAMRSPEAMVSGQSVTEDRFWKAGLIYWNPADSALMVPKRDGIGYTVNLGRPAAWVLLAVLIVVPLGILLLTHRR